MYIILFLFPINYKEKTRRRSTHTPHTIDYFAHFVALASISEQIENLKLLVDFEPTPKSSTNQFFQKPPKTQKVRPCAANASISKPSLVTFSIPFSIIFPDRPTFIFCNKPLATLVF